MQPDQLQIFASYTSWETSEDTWIINFMQGSQNMYLLAGTERALLIDCGWGGGTLRSFAQRLTAKPIEAVLTHGHMDHAGGCGEWEAVMMLPGALADLVTLRNGPFDLSSLTHPDYERRLVSDGGGMDLGGRRVEWMDISAHSNGSLAVFDRDRDQIFLGDEVDSSQVLMYDIAPGPDRPPFVLDQRLRAHRTNMFRLKEKLTPATLLFPAHNGAPIAHSYLDDFIGLVEHIYSGDAVIEDKLNHIYAEAGDPEHKLCRVRWKKASFFLNKEELMQLWGTGF